MPKNISNYNRFQCELKKNNQFKDFYKKQLIMNKIV